MNNYFNSRQVVEILIKWKIHLGIVVLSAIILSAFFSSPIFITPLYKSDAVVYPSNIAPYSEENVTEQSVEILNSRDIRDSLVKKYNLVKHWKIDSTSKILQTLIQRMYENRVKFWTTAYEAVKIEVRDPDPQIAVQIINSLLEYYNMKVRLLQKAKAKEVVDNYQRILQRKKEYLDSLKSRADELGTKYEILEYGSQTREIMRAYLSGGHRSADVMRLKKNLEEKGIEMLLLRDLMGTEASNYSTMKMEADRAQFVYEREYSYTNVLSKPKPADKKAYPIRSLIVVVSALVALLLALIGVAVYENRIVLKTMFWHHAE